jgi:hypothetical protein
LPVLADILTAELRADGVERVILGPPKSEEGPSPNLAAISIGSPTCESPAWDILVRIVDAATRKQVERHVLLADVAEPSRPRALALAVAELLRASWLELALPEAPPPKVQIPAVVWRAVDARVSSVTPRESGATPREAERDVALMLAWDAFPTAHASLVGGQVAVALPVGSDHWQLRVDSGALFGLSERFDGSAAA